MVVIRLSSVGRKGERKYRIVVKEKRSRRDGKSIEVLGWYEKGERGERKKLDLKRYEYWLGVGAIPSPQVKKLATA